LVVAFFPCRLRLLYYYLGYFLLDQFVMEFFVERHHHRLEVE
jgi:hypothetical protein